MSCILLFSSIKIIEKCSWLWLRVVELLVRAQQLYLDVRPARYPPPRGLSLTVTLLAANLTFADRGGGGGGGGDEEEAGVGGGEVPAKDLIVPLKVSSTDTILDINKAIRVIYFCKHKIKIL